MGWFGDLKNSFKISQSLASADKQIRSIYNWENPLYNPNAFRDELNEFKKFIIGILAGAILQIRIADCEREGMIDNKNYIDVISKRIKYFTEENAISFYKSYLLTNKITAKIQGSSRFKSINGCKLDCLVRYTKYTEELKELLETENCYFLEDVEYIRLLFFTEIKRADTGSFVLEENRLGSFDYDIEEIFHDINIFQTDLKAIYNAISYRSLGLTQ